MTPISRRLLRETPCAVHSAGRRRAIVIELDPRRPGLLGLRLKGTRTVYNLPIDWCYREAVRAELARRKAERRAQRRKGKAT